LIVVPVGRLCRPDKMVYTHHDPGTHETPDRPRRGARECVVSWRSSVALDRW
jgi:hypothetical protein